MARSNTEICFEGLNINRTLNLLSQKYPLFDVKRQGRQCKITVPSRVSRQVVAFLQDKCYNITKISKIGVEGWKDFFRRHFLLPVFLAVLCLVLFVASNICFDVRVSGDFSRTEVLSALESCGIGKGSFLWNFNADAAENSVANSLDAMYAVVNRQGSVLYVNAVKKKVAETPVDMHSRRDIVAPCDGTVTFVLCEQGTCAVKTGDAVKKGDVLVYGLRTFNDGTTQDVYALGEVVIRQQSVGFAPYTGTITQTVETGNTCVYNEVRLFGKNYGFGCGFASWREQRTSVVLYPLGITVERVVCFETATVTRAATLEECLLQLQEQALQQALQKADFTVTDTVYDVTAQGVYATVYGERHVR